MKVRLIEAPHGYVEVQRKIYWFSPWEYVYSVCGDDAWERAEKYALVLKNPMTKEIE
jgi:hypothetical protein